MLDAQNDSGKDQFKRLEDAILHMTLDDLKSLQVQIGSRIDELKTEELSAARAEIEGVARRYGYELADLLRAVPAGRKPRVSPQKRYVHPQRPALTWNGHGRRPGWLTELIEAGHDKGEFLVAT